MAQGNVQANRSPATPTLAARPPFYGFSPHPPATPRPPPCVPGTTSAGTPGTPPQGRPLAGSQASPRDPGGPPMCIRINMRITSSKAIGVSKLMVSCQYVTATLMKLVAHLTATRLQACQRESTASAPFLCVPYSEQDCQSCQTAYAAQLCWALQTSWSPVTDGSRCKRNTVHSTVKVA